MAARGMETLLQHAIRLLVKIAQYDNVALFAGSRLRMKELIDLHVQMSGKVGTRLLALLTEARLPMASDKADTLVPFHEVENAHGASSTRDVGDHDWRLLLKASL